jgi:hypothetical protein
VADERRAAYLRFVETCKRRRLSPIEQEHAILAIGREYLPDCAKAVLDGGDSTVEYWDWLLGQLTKHDMPKEK